METASARLSAPSLLKIAVMWSRTLFADSFSDLAISASVRPSTMSVSIWRCLSVRSLVGDNGSYHFGKFGAFDVLHHGAGRAGFERAGDAVGRSVCREDQYLHAGEAAVNLGCCLGTVHAGHHQVHENKIREQFRHLLERGIAVVRFAHDGEVGMGLER